MPCSMACPACLASAQPLLLLIRAVPWPNPTAIALAGTISTLDSFTLTSLGADLRGASPSRQVSTCRTRINVCACLVDADPCWQHPCSMQACRRRKSGREEIGSADPPRPRLCVSSQREHFQPLTMAGIDQRWRPVACPGRGQHRARGWYRWDGRGKASRATIRAQS